MRSGTDYDEMWPRCQPVVALSIMNIESTRLSCMPRLAIATLFGLSAVACDLEPKDLGDETDGASDAGDDDAGGTDSATSGGECTPGEQQPAPDGCNTCECTGDGSWACTDIGCGDSGGECVPGDEMPAGDGCNTCVCDDAGIWECTALGCNPGVCTPGEQMPDEDGCNTCTCDETGQWACTELACPPMNSFELCDGTEPADPLDVVAAAVVGDSLEVTVAYSGGCTEHVFRYCWDGSFLESNPVQVPTSISHDGMLDPCDAYPSEMVSFDLLPLKADYEAAYGAGPATIEINLAGWPGSLPYSW